MIQPWKYLLGLFLWIGLAVGDDTEVTVAETRFMGADRVVMLQCFSLPGKMHRPAILLLHGGPGYQPYRTSYDHYATILAKNGYTVYAVMYYDADDQRVMTSGNATERTRWYHQNISKWTDVVIAAVDYVAAQSTTSSDRIGVIGFSQGAFIAIGAAGLDERIDAVVDVYGGIPSALRGRIKRLPPTLILHGDADAAVPIREAYELANFLEQRSIEYDIAVYRGAKHGFDAAPESPRAQDAQQRALKFFDEQLSQGDVVHDRRSMNAGSAVQNRNADLETPGILTP